MGISIVPQSLARASIASSDVVFLELEDDNAYHELQLIWRESDFDERALPTAEFVNHVKRFFLEYRSSQQLSVP